MQIKRLFLAALLMTVLLSGCGSVKTEKIQETVTDGAVSVSYDRFTGQREFSAELSEEASFNVDITTRSGMLQLVILEEGQKPIYSGKITEDFSFTVNAEPGNYKIQLTGEKHSGSVSVSWK